MSILKVGKIQSGISLTPANNMVLDASADDGSFQLKRGDGTVILSVSAAGVVDINGSGAPYGKSNILGAISQSAGIPTGAIIEKGSNANGYYTKFADGTLMCWRSLTMNTSGTYPVGTALTGSDAYGSDVPATFISTPSVIASAIAISAPWPVSLITSCYTAPSATYFGAWRVLSANGYPAMSYIHVLAIGRWF